jgi:hypothetical protein
MSQPAVSEDGLTIRHLFGAKTWPWDRLQDVVLTANGRRVRTNPVRREPAWTVLLSFSGRLRRFTLTSEDHERFVADARFIVEQAQMRQIPVKVGMAGGSPFDWSEMLGLDLGE